MYRQTTRSIEVKVRPTYLEDHSRPDQGLYVWSYHIEIANHGEAPVQLRHRYWRILSSTGQLLEVRGEGVVGDQPRIEPGGRFHYSSFTNLPSSSGMMLGSYQMEAETGETFDIDIPAFSLDSPDQLALPN